MKHQPPKTTYYTIIIILIVLSSSLLLVLQPIDTLIRHLKDDAFYYFKVANNIAIGCGSTFDCINKTNGYHPLWMLHLIPIYWIYPDNPTTALRVILIIVALYHTAASVLLYRTAAQLHGVRMGVYVAVAWALCPITMRMNLSGMESALYAFCLTTLLYVITTIFKNGEGIWDIDVRKKRDLLGLGVLIGICVLARLDSIYLFAGILVTGMLPRAWKRADILIRVRAMVLVATPVVLLVSCYFLSNLALFGHFYPVSGRIKTPTIPDSIQVFLSDVLWPFTPIYRSSYQLIAIGLAGLFIACFGIMLFFRPALRQTLLLILRRYDWLLLGVVPLYIHMALSKTYIHNWYYVPFLLLLFLVVAEIYLALISFVALLPRVHRIGSRSVAVLVVLAYLGIGVVEFGPNKNDYVYKIYRSSFWVHDHLAEGQIGAAWNAGIIGYFSGRQVVNLDGLINSYDYYDALKAGQEPAFVARQGVMFVFDSFPVPDSGNTDGFMPAPQWAPYLEPYYEERYYAHNVGLSSFFTPVFPVTERDAVFMFKVWRLRPLPDP